MNTIAYNTSKAAAIHFTRKTLASPNGATTASTSTRICPGFFPTKLSAGLIDKLGDTLVIARAPHCAASVVTKTSRARWCSWPANASRHITGQVLAVDGGTSASLNL
jgi:NAD(P)-dependent dehydrogenase (short-subunit alcohol dehydrogenase family)